MSQKIVSPSRALVLLFAHYPTDNMVLTLVFNEISEVLVDVTLGFHPVNLKLQLDDQVYRK